MRSLPIIMLLATTPAAAEPLWEAELRIGYGVAIGGGDGMTSRRPTPLHVAAIGAIAIREEPWTYAYGGVVVETLDTSSVGATGGLRLVRGALRVAGGGTYVVAPFTLWGATASAGACHRTGMGKICGDLQLTTYFAGSDLADGHTVTQLQAVVGLVFDAL